MMALYLYMGQMIEKLAHNSNRIKKCVGLWECKNLCRECYVSVSECRRQTTVDNVPHNMKKTIHFD